MFLLRILILRHIRTITLTGYTACTEKRRTFKEACVFCLLSYTESCPIAVIEAMAYGLTL